MTHQTSKILLIISVSFLAGMGVACSSLGVKIYRLDAQQMALVRQQAHETIPLKQAEGYYCTSAEDTKKWVQAMKSCEELCKP